MARTPDRSWSNRCPIAGWLLLAPMLAFAQQAPYDGAETDLVPPPGDTLGDALTCRSDSARLWSLLPRLRRERPDEFAQAYRQYSQPMMDLYQLQAPVQAWGNIGDAVTITPNRMMLAVRGSMEEISARIDRELEASRESPLPGVLDNAHALVVYPAELPGLEGMVLLGCEYRIEGLSLLDDPTGAWRRYAPSPSTDASRPAVPGAPAGVPTPEK